MICSSSNDKRMIKNYYLCLHYLRGEHRADFGEEHMTREGKQDVISVGGKPHHPLKICSVL